MTVTPHRLVHGVGINDVGASVKGCPYYQRWKHLLMRCFCPKFQAKQPTYVGCTLDETWKSFTVFKNWMSQQNWQGKELDKDLICYGNKHYGPATCLFIPQAINLLMGLRGNDRGPYPLGVSKIVMSKGKHSYFQARCYHYGKAKRLGLFKTEEEASQAYKAAKLAYISELAAAETDPRIKQALLGLRVNF